MPTDVAPARWREARERIENARSRGGSLERFSICQSAVCSLAPRKTRCHEIYWAGGHMPITFPKWRGSPNMGSAAKPAPHGGHPWHFIKSSNTVTRPRPQHRIAAASSKVDWEGRACRGHWRSARCKGCRVERALEVLPDTRLATTCPRETSAAEMNILYIVPLYWVSHRT